jgi:hypothetical protein
MGGLTELSDDDGEALEPMEEGRVLSDELTRKILLMELTLGILNFVIFLSLRSLSRISHAKMVGLSSLYPIIISTTSGVATFGLDPPVEPAL